MMTAFVLALPALASCSHPDRAFPPRHGFAATAKAIRVTEADCRQVFANPEAPSASDPSWCPDYVRDGSWFEVRLRNLDRHPAWVNDCSIVGVDQSDAVLFRGQVHAGTYMGGIRVYGRHHLVFRTYSFDPPHGLVKTPSGIARFKVWCRALHPKLGQLPT